MPVDDGRPFGYDTLKLRAIFVPEGNPDGISKQQIVTWVGHNALKIPAVLVPDGSDIAPPGPPYVHFGRYVLRPDGGLDVTESGPDAARAGSWVEGAMDGAANAGAAASGQQGRRPLLPVPALAQSQGYVDPVPSGMTILRGTADPSSVWRKVSAAGVGSAVSTRSAPAAEVAAPSGQLAVSHKPTGNGETVAQPGSSAQTIRMLVTGYDNSYESTGKNPGDPGYGITASGQTAKHGTIAAPSNYSFGTKMYVP